MPFLGRQGQSPGRQPQPTGRLCQSPLFGLRRQLMSSDGGDDGKSAAAVAASSVPRAMTKHQIRLAFEMMDKNADGLIDLRDLSQMLANLGLPIDDAILCHVMAAQVSKRGDNHISENEFIDWLSQFVEICPEGSLSALSSGSSSSSPSSSRSSRSTTRPVAAAGGGSRIRATAGKSLRLLSGQTTSSTSNKQPTSSGSTLSAFDPEAEGAAQTLSGSGRRRGSVGSGLALMRSLSSGSSSASANAEQSPAIDDPNEETRNDLRAAFCVFDLDGDGYITLDEVSAGLKLIGEDWTRAELLQVFAGSSVAGGRGDDPTKRRINIDDFVKLLL